MDQIIFIQPNYQRNEIKENVIGVKKNTQPFS